MENRRKFVPDLTRDVHERTSIAAKSGNSGRLQLQQQKDRKGNQRKFRKKDSYQKREV